MAFQFGTVGALGPAIGEASRADAAAVGLLVGLYLSPGLLFALPGGAIARTFGDKRVVLAGVALMVLGGMVSAISMHWEAQLAGRFLAGTSGVVINVLMSKMITDWFAGREIATAMALFVNSWPAGIGLALLVQPHVAAVGGVPLAFALTAMLAAMAFVALLAGYQQGPAETVTPGGFPRGAALACVLAAGAIWGLFNASFSMLFAFGPLLLSGKGWQLAAASSASSIPVWLCAIAVAGGGVMADRLGRANAVMVIGLLLMALGMLALPRSDMVVPALVLIGLSSGLPVGAIMGLPARVLTPSTRAAGTGLFFTVFYGSVVAAPSLAGALIDVTLDRERDGFRRLRAPRRDSSPGRIRSDRTEASARAGNRSDAAVRR